MPTYANIGGIWRDTSRTVNVGGIWRTVYSPFVNIGGVWRSVSVSNSQLYNLGLVSIHGGWNGFQDNYWYWLYASSGSSSASCRSVNTYTLKAGTVIGLTLNHRTNQRDNHENTNGKQARIFFGRSSTYSESTQPGDYILFLNPTTGGKPWSHTYYATVTLDRDVVNSYFWACVDNNRVWNDYTNLSISSVTINGTQVNKP